MVEIAAEKSASLSPRSRFAPIRFVSTRIVGQGRGTFTLFLLATLAIGLFLLATVHRRDMNYVAAQVAPNRWKPVVMVWIEEGYFKNGGMMYIRHPGYREAPYFYRSLSGGFLQGIHGLQRVSYWLTGRYSYRLTTLHNQAAIAIAAALLGLLVMRLCRRLLLSPVHAACLGFGAALVYQTFPANLLNYWMIVPQSMTMIFVALFLVLEEASLDGASIRWPMRALTVFALIYMDYIAGGLFLAGYCLAVTFLRPDLYQRDRRAFLRDIPLPAILAVGTFRIQQLWVQHRYPREELLGGTFLYRSGLDGSSEWYRDHFALLFGRHLSYAYPALGNPEFRHWKWLFVAGVAGVLVLVACALRMPLLRRVMLLPASVLALYSLYAFVFSQAVVLHSELYDPMLVFPLVMVVFGLLPATAESATNHSGLFVFIATLIAICYSMVQLRSYAAMIPLG